MRMVCLGVKQSSKLQVVTFCAKSKGLVLDSFCWDPSSNDSVDSFASHSVAPKDAGLMRKESSPSPRTRETSNSYDVIFLVHLQ